MTSIFFAVGVFVETNALNMAPLFAITRRVLTEEPDRGARISSAALSRPGPFVLLERCFDMAFVPPAFPF
jgi:hypothetical protein